MKKILADLRVRGLTPIPKTGRLSRAIHKKITGETVSSGVTIKPVLLA